MSKKLRGTKCSINKAGGLRRVMLALVVLLLAATLFVGAGSAENTLTLSGSGTSESPFLITTVDELKGVRDAINTGTESITSKTDASITAKAEGAHYKLAATDKVFDLNNVEWEPIKKNVGGFDGDNQTIKNLRITTCTDWAVGFFGLVSSNGATISNLKFENVHIASSSTQYTGAGTLLGWDNIGGFTIKNCHVTGTIQIQAKDFAGGLIGYSTGGADYGYGGTTIIDCSVKATDTNSYIKNGAGNAEANDGSVGGLVGFHGNGAGSISGCTVDVPVSGQNAVGGLVGRVTACEDNAVISDCSAKGTVTLVDGAASTTTNLAAGGLVGDVVASASFAKIEDCESTSSIKIEVTETTSKPITVGLVGGAYGDTEQSQVSDITTKVTSSTMTLDSESAKELVQTLGADKVLDNVGAVTVKDQDNNVVLVEGIDQTIVTTAADGTIITTSTVTWDNEGKAVISGATVDDSGNIQIGGNTIVTEDSEPVTSTSSDVTLSSTEFTCDKTELEFGELIYGYSEPASQQVTLSSNDNSAVTIEKITSTSFDASFSGAVVTVTPKTGLDAGNHKEPVTIILNGGTALQITANVTVTQAEATLSFEHDAISKSENDEAFTNEVTNTGDGTVTYTSSNTAVATVDANGKVTIAAAGTTTITATAAAGTNYKYNDATAEYQLTVYESESSVTGEAIPETHALVANPVDQAEKDTVTASALYKEKLAGTTVFWINITLLNANGVEDHNTEITFTVPYPTGITAENAGDYNFIVLHLKDGTTVEHITKVTTTANGLKITSKVSPFAIGYSLQNSGNGGSSTPQGSSVWLTEPLTPTPTETVQPTPTDVAPTDIPATQPTQTETPGFGVLAVLAGLGAVAVLRRK